MKTTLERRLKRLEKERDPEQGVIILDREPEPGEFPPGVVVIVDDIPRGEQP